MSRALDDVLGDVIEELDRATKLHPIWPDDLLRQVAIVCEESGEAIRAVLNNNKEETKMELIQTAAMALRALMHLP